MMSHLRQLSVLILALAFIVLTACGPVQSTPPVSQGGSGVSQEGSGVSQEGSDPSQASSGSSVPSSDNAGENPSFSSDPGTTASQPGTAAARTWADVEAAHYCGSDLCAPEDILLPEGERFLKAYPLYTNCAATREEIFELFQPMTFHENTSRLEDALTVSDNCFGYLATTMDTGEATMEEFCFRETSQSGRTYWGPRWGNGLVNAGPTGVSTQQGCRTSLALDDALVARLEEMGFFPDATRAVSFYLLPGIDFDISGILFSSDEREAVLLTHFVGPDQTPLCDLDGVPLSLQDFAKLMMDNFDALFPEGGEDLNPMTAKPVLYLYPEIETRVSVKLGYPADQLTYTFPAYRDGWKVLAQPDGTLTDLADGSTHYYLFWEGDKAVDWDQSQGFVVKGSELEGFLREKLPLLGLLPREYNDFITYWVPRLQDAPYLLLTFAGEQYEELAPLEITPAPDSVLRVHMVYKVLSRPVDIPPQTLSPFVREGFTVVEWGGSKG